LLFEDSCADGSRPQLSASGHPNVRNLTDVDDRLINNATEHHHGMADETAPLDRALLRDVDTLASAGAHHYPRATRYHRSRRRLWIELLEAKGVPTGARRHLLSHRRLSEIRAASGMPPPGVVAG